jgi:protein phosphatase
LWVLAPARSSRGQSCSLRAPDGRDGVVPDVNPQDARSGDRCLLCSDGLSAVAPPEDIRQVLASAPDPDRAVRGLITLARDAAGPDNVTCVVADVVELRP